jgi:hypothetical protein
VRVPSAGARACSRIRNQRYMNAARTETCRNPTMRAKAHTATEGVAAATRLTGATTATNSVPAR